MDKKEVTEPSVRRAVSGYAGVVTTFLRDLPVWLSAPILFSLTGAIIIVLVTDLRSYL
jgi:hypothetical protein